MEQASHGSYGDSTRCIHAGVPPAVQGEPFLPGPTFAAPFHVMGDPATAPHMYGRYSNPTWSAYEQALGELEGGEAVLFGSGMAAVTADGVVGKVVATYGRTAEVQLLVDSASAVAARVQRSRARVTVRGTGEEKRLELANALRTDDIESGDILVTSGTDRVFPKGLVIGRIGRVHREPYGMYLEGEIRPAVDVSGLEEVLVIVSSGEDEDLPTAEVHEEPIPVLPGLP